MRNLRRAVAACSGGGMCSIGFLVASSSGGCSVLEQIVEAHRRSLPASAVGLAPERVRQRDA